MKKLLTVLIAFYCFATTTKAQENLDSIQIERIGKTSQLWGHLKYFHPNLNDNSINWEKAFTDNIDEIIDAGSKQELKVAVQKMLFELRDPITTVIETPQKPKNNDSTKYPIISYLKDSILLVSIKDYSDLEDFYYCHEQFSTLREKIPKSSGVIFDIRNQFELTDDLKGWLTYYFPTFESYLSDQTLEIPGFKARFHDGFVPETGSPSGGYSSGYYVQDEKKIKPASGAVNKKVIFIVNRSSELPISVLALQGIGQGFILSTDTISDASFVHTTNYELEDSVQVRLRLDELAIDYKVKADYLFSTNVEESEIIEIARQYLRGNKQAKANLTLNANKTKYKFANANSSSSTSTSYYPDLEYRLLAAAKIWTVIDYFFAYKDLMVDDWNGVLREFIPRFANASDSLEYHLVVAEMYKHIQDGHGFIRSEVLSNYFGTASPPIRIRFIENQPVVVSIFPDSMFSVRGIELGDVITKIDGESVESVIKRHVKYLSASNLSALNNYVSRRLLNGNDSTTVAITIRKKNNKNETIELPRYNSFYQYSRQLGNGRNHESIVTLINKDIGYADLDRLTSDMVDKMFEDFKNTKAIIFDMRGYPNGTAWSIVPHLTNKKREYAANFRRYSPMSMKVGDYFTENITVFNQAIPTSKPPYYEGITIMLIDERTQSQAEHTGLFFEAANNTTFIGSPTAGANGDVTNFQIPGNITLFFSGHDVRHIDGRQLQKVGLVPDKQVKPTIEGIRKGKDEVLENAIEYIENIIHK